MKASVLSRKNEKGQSIVEAVMCMLLVCLILFSLLQIFYISVAQMLTHFSAFSVARSRSVGFSDYLTHRRGKTAVMGASGKLTTVYSSSNINPEVERAWALRYHQGIEEIEYEYWETANNSSGTSFWVSVNSGVSTVEGDVGFSNYPLDFPMRGAFTSRENVDIESNAEMMNYDTYREE